MAAHGARRLAPMAENAGAVIAIEALAAAQGCDFLAPLASSPTLEIVRTQIRAVAPHLDEDRYFHPDISAAHRLVASGALYAAASPIPLPSLEGTVD